MGCKRQTTYNSFSNRYLKPYGLLVYLYITVFVSESTVQSCTYQNIYKDRCYFLNVSRDGSTFDQANATCNSTSGYVLASVTDMDVLTFINQLIIQKWTTVDYCERQLNECKTSPSSCREHNCLNFWIGLYHDNHTLCEGCSNGNYRIKQGWKWLDGSQYDVSQTKWANQEPTLRGDPVRIGVLNNSLNLYIGDREKDKQFGFICSKPAEGVNTPTIKVPPFNGPSVAGATTISASISVTTTSTITTTTETITTTAVIKTNPISSDSPSITSSGTIPNGKLTEGDSPTFTSSNQQSSATLHTTAQTNSTASGDSKRNLIIGLAAGIGGGVLLLVFIIIVIIIVLRRHKKQTATNKTITRDSTTLGRDLRDYARTDSYSARTKSVYPPMNYSSSQGDDPIEPYSFTPAGNPNRADPESIDEIEPYGISSNQQRSGALPEISSAYGTPLGTSAEDEYANGDQVQPKAKKSKSGGIYGMLNRAQQKFTNNFPPIYAVPDKSKKTAWDKKKPPVKEKPKK